MSFAGVRLDQRRVVANILLRHSLCGKSLLKMPAHLTSVELGQSPNRLYGFCFSSYDEASDAVVDDLRR